MDNKSKYAQHILDTTHNYDTAEKTMTILHIERKGRMLNALECYHIYELTKQKSQMNEALTDYYNPIYEILLKEKSQHMNPTPFQNQLPTTPPATAPYIVARQQDVSTTAQPR
jgi:hypothetical protein